MCRTRALPLATDIQFEEKKVRKAITDAAKRNDMATCKVRLAQVAFGLGPDA